MIRDECSAYEYLDKYSSVNIFCRNEVSRITNILPDPP